MKILKPHHDIILKDIIMDINIIRIEIDIIIYIIIDDIIDIIISVILTLSLMSSLTSIILTFEDSKKMFK